MLKLFVHYNFKHTAVTACIFFAEVSGFTEAYTKEISKDIHTRMGVYCYNLCKTPCKSEHFTSQNNYQLSHFKERLQSRIL